MMNLTPKSETVEAILVAVLTRGVWLGEVVSVGPRHPAVADQLGGWAVHSLNGCELAIGRDPFWCARHAAAILEGLVEPDASTPPSVQPSLAEVLDSQRDMSRTNLIRRGFRLPPRTC